MQPNVSENIQKEKRERHSIFQLCYEHLYMRQSKFPSVTITLTQPFINTQEVFVNKMSMDDRTVKIVIFSEENNTLHDPNTLSDDRK